MQSLAKRNLKIRLLSRYGKVAEAKKEFEEIINTDGCVPDVNSYTGLAAAYLRQDSVDDVVGEFKKALAADLEPNTKLMTIVLMAHRLAKDVDGLRSWWRYATSSEVPLNLYSVTNRLMLEQSVCAGRDPGEPYCAFDTAIQQLVNYEKDPSRKFSSFRLLPHKHCRQAYPSPSFLHGLPAKYHPPMLGTQEPPAAHGQASIDRNPGPAPSMDLYIPKPILSKLFDPFAPTKVFLNDALEQIQMKPNAAVYAAIMHGYHSVEHLRGVNVTWAEMLRAGIEPDIRGYSTLLTAHQNRSGIRKVLSRYRELEVARPDLLDRAEITQRFAYKLNSLALKDQEFTARVKTEIHRTIANLVVRAKDVPRRPCTKESPLQRFFRYEPRVQYILHNLEQSGQFINVEDLPYEVFVSSIVKTSIAHGNWEDVSFLVNCFSDALHELNKVEHAFSTSSGVDVEDGGWTDELIAKHGERARALRERQKTSRNTMRAELFRTAHISTVRRIFKSTLNPTEIDYVMYMDRLIHGKCAAEAKKLFEQLCAQRQHISPSALLQMIKMERYDNGDINAFRLFMRTLTTGKLAHIDPVLHRYLLEMSISRRELNWAAPFFFWNLLNIGHLPPHGLVQSMLSLASNSINADLICKAVDEAKKSNGTLLDLLATQPSMYSSVTKEHLKHPKEHFSKRPRIHV